MLTHAQVWAAVDRLAERYGLTASGLSRKAGLDPTTFNKSKRVGPDGRDRWPSTESVSKCLAATGASVEEFMRLLIPEGGDGRRTVPIVGMAQAGAGRLFDDEGVPVGGPGWGEIELPDLGRGRGVFAIEIQGDSMRPLYRQGDVILVAPGAPVRRGDRVVVRTVGGEVLAKELKRKNAKGLDLLSLNPEHPDRHLPAEEIDWVARVMWARQ